MYVATYAVILAIFWFLLYYGHMFCTSYVRIYTCTYMAKYSVYVTASVDWFNSSKERSLLSMVYTHLELVFTESREYYEIQLAT